MSETGDGEARRLQSRICQNDISFVSRDITERANSARSVFAIDLDGDSDVDVLSASEDDDTIAWFESDGESPPNFDRHEITTSADGAVSVFAIDLDGDGDVDVLSAGEDDDTIAWYENDGGSPPFFQTRVITDTADDARAVFAIDLDGDFDIDVLSASVRDDTVAWYENDGGASPNFVARTITDTADGARSVVGIDLDGDGDVDVLSASVNDDTIAWYESDGGAPPGLLKHAITTETDGAFTVFAIHLDGDEDVDVLSANSVADTVTWYENDGEMSPTFEMRVISDTAIAARSVFAIDLDGDEDVDVLSASNRDSTLSWYANDGGVPPEFTEKPISAVVDGARSVFAIDVDGDNDVDVLSASEDDDTIAWHENNCDFVRSTATYEPSALPAMRPSSTPLPGPSQQPTEHPLSPPTFNPTSSLPTDPVEPSLQPTETHVPTSSSTLQRATPTPSPRPSNEPSLTSLQMSTLPTIPLTWLPSARPTDSPNSSNRQKSTDFWDMIGAIIGIVGIIIPTFLWWVDKGRDYPRRRCCPQVHFCFFDWCKLENRDFNAYRELYQSTAPTIVDIAQATTPVMLDGEATQPSSKEAP